MYLIFVVLADTIAGFFNGNPKFVLSIFQPIVDDTAADFSKALVSRALATLTKDEIFPYKSK